MKKPTLFYQLFLILVLSLCAVFRVDGEPIAASVNSVASNGLSNKTASDNTAFNATTTINHDWVNSIHSTEFQLLSTREQQTLAAVWGLNAVEYAHYLEVMEHSVDGLYYRDQHLDPAWVLGINAKTEAEQRKYVTLAVLHERERMRKLLRFQQAFDRIQHELFPTDQPIPVSEQDKNHLIPVTCR